jgi:tyrosyl-tRNA synthetase
VAETLPTGTVSSTASVTDLLLATGLARSRSDARRLVGEGGVYLNNQRVSDPEATVAADERLAGRWLVLRRGKRSVAVAEVAPG